jgi:Tol biopolymer transport system component
VVVFDSNRTGIFDLYRKNVDGPPGTEQLLYADHRTKFPMSFSPDGRHLLYFTVGDPKTHSDVWALPDPLTSPGQPSRILGTEFSENTPMFSPDGRWIAYSSTESGAPEVWVTPFPDAIRRYLVSRSGGLFPRWRPDGSEIYYVTPGGDLMVVAVRTSAGGFQVGTPSRLFGGLLIGTNAYDISSDGQRILAVVVPPEVEESPLTVVRGWLAVRPER